MTSRRVRTVVEQAGSHPAIQVEERSKCPVTFMRGRPTPEMRGQAEERTDRAIASCCKSAFARGLSCLGYEREVDGQRLFSLGRWDEDWSYTPNSVTGQR